MKHVLNIIKKELDKVFKNPRLFFTTFIMPGVLIFAIYATMGNLANTELEKATNNTSNIYIVDVSTSFKDIIDIYNQTYPEGSEGALNTNFTYYSSEDVTKENLDKALENGECNAYVIFDKDFDDVLDNRLTDQSAKLPEVSIYMLSTSTMSGVASDKVTALLNILKDIKIKEKITVPNSPVIVPPKSSTNGYVGLNIILNQHFEVIPEDFLEIEGVVFALEE